MLHRAGWQALTSQKQAGRRGNGCQAPGPDGICWSTRPVSSPVGLMQAQTGSWKPGVERRWWIVALEWLE